MTNIFSPEQVSIKNIIINAERFNKPLILAGEKVEGAPSAIELNVYESLGKPYLTGSLIIQDDADVYRLTDMSGTERIIVEYQAADMTSNVITKTFIIRDVQSQVKSNDYTSILVINLIEDRGYYNNLTTINRSYTGSGEEIISKILRDGLNTTIDIKSDHPSFQRAFRYIVPNISPFDAVQRVLRKMTTEVGLPYFVSSSMYSDNLLLTDLQTIISSEPFNVDRPFTYSQASANQSPNDNDIESQALTIYSYEHNGADDTLSMALSGAMGSRYKNLDTSTGAVYDTHINTVGRFDTLIENDIIKRGYRSTSIDLEFIADPQGIDLKTITEYDTKHIVEVSSAPYPTIYDASSNIVIKGVNGFNQEDYQSFNELRTVRDNFFGHLLKNVYTIHIPGIMFTYYNINLSVGNLIEVEVYKNDVEAKTTDVVDSRRSGNYVMLARRHIFDFQADRHNVSIDIARVSNKESTL